MKLISVKSASHTTSPTVSDFLLTATFADDGSGDQIGLPFTLTSEDGGDMASQVTAWLAANPDFVVQPYSQQAPTADDVWAEKDRRWALGFDYNFGDSRGVHHIGTTPKDMEDWDKVTALAQAAINLGQPNTTINIMTNTGPVAVTAMEWQQLVIAVGAFQQPIFIAAMALASMAPIPADYAVDSRWPAVQ